MKFYEFNLYRISCVKDKIVLKTKLFAALIFSFSVQAIAAEPMQITLSEKNAPLETVLEKIGEQSKYDIIFNSNLIKRAKPVTVHAKNAPLLNILAECFLEQPLGYTVSTSTIVVNEKKNVDITISGTVKDALGKPVPGASVVVKGLK